MEPVYSRSPLTLSSDALWEETPWSRTSPLTDETVTSLASMSSTSTSPLTLSMAACLAERARRTPTSPEADLACTSSETSVTRTSPLTDCAFAAPATPTRRTLPETDWISTSVPFGTLPRDAPARDGLDLALGSLRHLHAVAHGDVPVVVPMAAALSGVLRRDPHAVSELGHLDVDALQELRIPLLLDALDGVDHARRARPALDVGVARDVADRERGGGSA